MLTQQISCIGWVTSTAEKESDDKRESSLTCHRCGLLHRRNHRCRPGSRWCHWWSILPRSPRTADQYSLTHTNTDLCSGHICQDPKSPHHHWCSCKGLLDGKMEQHIINKRQKAGKIFYTMYITLTSTDAWHNFNRLSFTSFTWMYCVAAGLHWKPQWEHSWSF